MFIETIELFMEKKDYSVLLIGNFESVFVVQFVKNLKKSNPYAHLYFWGYTRDESDTDRSFIDCYDEYSFFNIKRIINSSVFWRLKAIVQLRKSFRTFVSDKHFDYINIHYIKPEYFFILDYLKSHASTLVLSPWGSDVYGAKGINKLLVKRTFNSADYITGGDGRFAKDFMQIFSVPEKKFVLCKIGVETIEYIIEHKNLIDINEAKRRLGIENKYVITCGYKAMSSHQHLRIIEAIREVKDQLPSNLLLLFPLTYPNDPKYVQEIKEKVEKYGLEAVYYDHFLDMQNLFLLRQATDMFIHVQPTDASSASLWEYILCEKKIVNGAWLQYPELIKNGVTPYFVVNSLDTLGQKIVEVYQSKPIKMEKELFLDFEKKQWKVVIRDWDLFFSGNIIQE